MDAQIEKVIADVIREFHAECDHSHEICGECAEAALRELAQRVLEIAAQECDANFPGCTYRPNCHSLDAEAVRSLADGPQKGKTT